MKKNFIRFELTDLINLLNCYLFEKKPKQNLLAKFIEVPWENQGFKLQTLIAISMESADHISIPNWSILITEIIGHRPNKQNFNNHPNAVNYLFKSKNIFELFVEKNSKNKYFESYKLIYVPVFNYYIGTLDSLSFDGFETNKIAIGKINGSFEPKDAAGKIIKSYLNKEKLNGNARSLIKIKKNEILKKNKIYDCFS